MLDINRQKVMDAFVEYTGRYDAQDPKIKLKIDHTYRVAGLSQKIASSLNLPQEDIELAWLIGMLHDIGRFEQLRQYGTFSDRESIDHAQFGVRLLFDEGLLGEFLWEDCGDEGEYPQEGHLDTGKAEAQRELDILRAAIWNHSAYRLEEGLDERTQMFCHIIRDADKIDILKVNHDVPIEDIYNVTSQELYRSEVTPEVMDAFFEEHAVLRNLKKTPVDHLVGHSALVFELVYPISYQLVWEQGYLDKILGFESDNPATREQFRWLRERMDGYMGRKLQQL